MKQQLALYAELKQQADTLNEQVRQLANEINATMLAEGVESAMAQTESGVTAKAYFKPGGNSTDHEAAAKTYADASVLAETVAKYTTTKTTTTIAWAKVTKELKVDKTPFVTQGAPTFVIEVM